MHYLGVLLESLTKKSCCRMLMVEAELQINMVVDRKPIPFRVHMVVFPFPTQACICLVILLSKSLVVEYNVAFTFMSTTPKLDNTHHGFKGKDERFQDHHNNICLNTIDM